MTRADLLDLALYHLMLGLPPTACSDLGARLSPYIGKRPHMDQHRHALQVFARLRPEWAASEAELERAVERLWSNIGRTYAEFAASHRILKAGRVTIEGRAGLNAALTSGRPIIAIFPHLGNWELSEMQIGFLAPHRGAVIVDPPSQRSRAIIAERVRRKAPADLLPVSPTLWRRALERLKTPGGGIMMAVDEPVAGRVLSPAFDGPARVDGNLGKAARLAMMTGALVLPFYNERLPGVRFVTHVLPAMEFSGRPSDAAAIRQAVERMNAALRAPILRLLDQWYMALFVAV